MQYHLINLKIELIQEQVKQLAEQLPKQVAAKEPEKKIEKKPPPICLAKEKLQEYG